MLSVLEMQKQPAASKLLCFRKTPRGYCISYLLLYDKLPTNAVV